MLFEIVGKFWDAELNREVLLFNSKLIFSHSSWFNFLSIMKDKRATKLFMITSGVRDVRFPPASKAHEIPSNWGYHRSHFQITMKQIKISFQVMRTNIRKTQNVFTKELPKTGLTDIRINQKYKYSSAKRIKQYLLK